MIPFTFSFFSGMRLREQKLQKDIESVNKECKNHQSNTQAYKKQYEEVTEQLMNFKREVDRFQSQVWVIVWIVVLTYIISQGRC